MGTRVEEENAAAFEAPSVTSASPIAGLMADPGLTAALPDNAPFEFRPLPVVARSSTQAAPSARLKGRFWRDLSIGGFLVILCHVFLVQVSVVRGLSMSPSLRDGDRLMVDRLTYSLAEVERFDIVVLRYPKNPNVDFVKRVVGLPGDRVELRSGGIKVNGNAVPEEFAHICDMHADGSWVVPKGSFFVLGDNRPISCDSREFGMVDRDLLKGKVRVVFWPLDRFVMF